MHTRSSNVSSSAIADVKSLLELLHDPKAVKHALAEIEESTNELNAKQSALAVEQVNFDKEKSEYAPKQENLEALYKTLEAKDLKLKNFESALNERQSAIDFNERELGKKLGAFEEYKQSEQAKITEKESAAETKLSEAGALQERLSAQVKEYDSKLAKLKAAVG